MRPETLAIHAGRQIDPTTGAVTVPIHLSTTFARQEDGGYPGGTSYSRYANPNRTSLEEALAALEGGARGFCFSSGMAAAQAVFQALKPGDRVVLPNEYYFVVRSLAAMFTEWGIEVEEVDQSDLSAVKNALEKPTTVLWLETPSNPQLKISDLSALAALAKDAGAWTVCDNTWATPMLQNPIEHGIDVVLHATTKYIGGHSDVLGGALVVREEGSLSEKLSAVQIYGGAVPSPFECWLALRGLSSLQARMRVHCENARIVANWLQGRPEVERVCYPGLADHPGTDIAHRQMRDMGGMVSFWVRGTEEDARKVANRCKLIIEATSLGGTHSLIEHRKSVEGPTSNTPAQLLRLSVGLEHPLDILEDLHQALAGTN